MKRGLIFRNETVAVALFFSLCCLLPSVRADAPRFLWAQRAGGTNQEYGTRIAVDSAGNSYAIGKFSGPSMPIGNFVLTNGGLFIAKYDSLGEVAWAKQVGPASLGQASATGYWVPEVGADNAGNAYLLASFAGQVDFGVTNLSTTNSRDFFLAKYDSF